LLDYNASNVARGCGLRATHLRNIPDWGHANADISWRVDRIKAGAFEDTNRLFSPPVQRLSGGSTTSPAFTNRGGVRLTPTPPRAPMTMTSPGSKGTVDLEVRP